MNKLQSTSPVEVLLEEFISPFGIEYKDFQNKLGYSEKYTKKITRGEIKINKTISKKLAKIFNTSSDFWLNLQNNYDKELENEKDL